MISQSVDVLNSNVLDQRAGADSDLTLQQEREFWTQEARSE